MRKLVITAVIVCFSSSALFSQSFDEQIKQMSFDAFVASMNYYYLSVRLVL